MKKQKLCVCVRSNGHPFPPLKETILVKGKWFQLSPNHHGFSLPNTVFFRNLIIYKKLVHKSSVKVLLGNTELTQGKRQATLLREIKVGLKKELLYYRCYEARCGRWFSIWWMHQKTAQSSEMKRRGQERPGQAN